MQHHTYTTHFLVYSVLTLLRFIAICSQTHIHIFFSYGSVVVDSIHNPLAISRQANHDNNNNNDGIDDGFFPLQFSRNSFLATQISTLDMRKILSHIQIAPCIDHIIEMSQ